jgi:hypothetical protein
LVKRGRNSLIFLDDLIAILDVGLSHLVECALDYVTVPYKFHDVALLVVGLATKPLDFAGKRADCTLGSFFLLDSVELVFLEHV